MALRVVEGVAVSIHAPREGCDSICLSKIFLHLSFNSRTPGGVRRPQASTDIIRQIVSIHAPREGCDLATMIALYISLMFQFTHPGRGATVWCKVAYYRADKQA